MATCNTLFVKVERLRRLYPAQEHTFQVRRGEDNSFGLGLSEDNEVIHFYHLDNAGMLRIGDQVSAVGRYPLVREKLAALLQRRFADDATVPLHISRGEPSSGKANGDAFMALQLRTADGEEIEEWLSEIWELRTDAVWGTFWTLPILPDARTVWVGLHLSKLFTEPLLGCVEIPIESLPAEEIDTRWYSLRAEDAAPNSVCR